MQNRYDWFGNTNRIRVKSLGISFFIHFFIFFISLLNINSKEKKLEHDFLVVNLIPLTEFEIPIYERKEMPKLEKKSFEIRTPKENLEKTGLPKVEKLSPFKLNVDKKSDFSEKFSTEEYKEKLLSKLSKANENFEGSKFSQQTKKSSSLENIVPEIKSLRIESENSQIFSQIGSIRSPYQERIPDWFINLIKKRIEENWTVKENLIDLKAIISFRIYRDGRVENIAIEKSSGYKSFDNSIIEAIKSVKRWPEFPSEVKDKYLDIVIEFKTEG